MKQSRFDYRDRQLATFEKFYFPIEPFELWRESPCRARAYEYHALAKLRTRIRVIR